MTRLARDAVGAVLIAVTSYLLGILHGTVMSVQAFEDVLGVEGDGDEPEGLAPCPQGDGCADCAAAIEDLRSYARAFRVTSRQ